MTVDSGQTNQPVKSGVISESSSMSGPVVWHGLTAADVFAQLQSNPVRGLTDIEASQRLAQFGRNTLSHSRERSALSIVVAQFRSLIVVLLVVATAIAFLMNDVIEAIAILVVILINAGIGFFTEWKAERALSALQKQAVPVAHVIRDGVECEIAAEELVPGDLIVLAAGARVPADGRIVESARLQIEEAALTGESLAVTKSPDVIDDQDATLGDRTNMAFLGTTISNGRGRLVVTATGAQTELGQIGVLIDEAETRSSPLELQLQQLGRVIVVIVMAMCAIIVLAGWIRGATNFWQMLKVGISLAIAAVPEGLPAATTMTLALGMQQMARRRALVRRLPAVETLGAVTVICTDKTGTLTRNEMTVRVFLFDKRRVDVTGTGYAAKSRFLADQVEMDCQSDEQLVMALRIGMLCNDAKVSHQNGDDAILGDPTEAALVIAAEKAGIIHAKLMKEFPRVSEVPFDSVSKRMITVHRTPAGSTIAFIKGSPGTLIAASKAQLRDDGAAEMMPEDRQHWEEKNRELASQALRVLGLAYCEQPQISDEGKPLENLIFVGLVGMSDPLRDEAKDAIITCRDAGIRTVMMTGDQQATAAEIARQLGIDSDFDGQPLRTVHGRELADLDEAGWQQVVTGAAVFARVSPEHKLRIVEALQRQGHVVAMTGDGVNDAPALKLADIGIAMGIKGTEVAKENSDMVITDDNFASIVSAVEQGRIIYDNILRFIHYLFSCNFSEVLTVFFALILGWPLPLLAMQILWLNLVTDVFPAFALAREPSAPGMMKRPPRDPNVSLLPLSFIGLIAWEGLLLAVVTLFAFWIGMRWHGSEAEGLRRATTMAFMTLALTQVFHVFNARSRNRSALTRQLLTNGWLWAAVFTCVILQVAAVSVPLLQRVLHTVPLTGSEWGVIAICSLIPLLVVELVKVIRRATRRLI